MRRRVRTVLENLGLRDPPQQATSAPISPLGPELAAAALGEDDTAGPPIHALPPLTEAQVLELIDARVRPALQSDGGDIEILKVEDNDVYVRLVGACVGCPSSSITMRMGVERLLREQFPQLGHLVEVRGPGLA